MTEADIEERSALLQRALTRDALAAGVFVVAGSFAVLVLRIWPIAGARWLGIAWITLCVIVAAAWTRRRRDSWARTFGLLCECCGHTLVDLDGTLLLRVGSCTACGYVVVDARNLLVANLQRNGPVARINVAQKAEFRRRLQTYRRSVARELGGASILLLTLFVTGDYVADRWTHYFWVDVAVSGGIFFMGILSMGFLYTRCKNLEARFGLVCRKCRHNLVGGEHDELTRATIATGQCSHCGTLVF